jgi:hypothetical protein
MNKTESVMCVCVLFVCEAGFPKPKATNKAQDTQHSNAPNLYSIFLSCC